MEPELYKKLVEKEKKILNSELYNIFRWALIIMCIGIIFILFIMIFSYIMRGVCSNC